MPGLTCLKAALLGAGSGSYRREFGIVGHPAPSEALLLFHSLRCRAMESSAWPPIPDRSGYSWGPSADEIGAWGQGGGSLGKG
jgi:hypothetical protein